MHAAPSGGGDAAWSPKSSPRVLSAADDPAALQEALARVVSDRVCGRIAGALARIEKKLDMVLAPPAQTSEFRLKLAAAAKDPNSVSGFPELDDLMNFSSCLSHSGVQVISGGSSAKTPSVMMPMLPAGHAPLAQCLGKESSPSPRTIGQKAGCNVTSSAREESNPSSKTIGQGSVASSAREVSKCRHKPSDPMGPTNTFQKYKDDLMETEDETSTWLKDFMEAQEPHRSGRLASVVKSERFIHFFFLVIVANSVYTVVSTNYSAKRLDLSPTWAMSFEVAFFAAYMVELTMKLLVHKGFFFWNKDWAWNWFDVVMVISAGVELVLALFGLNSLNLAFMRIYRVLKTSKILRVFKSFRVFSDLRLMIDCVLGSMVSLFWSCALLVLILLLGSLVFVQSTTQFIVDYPERADEQFLKDWGAWFGSTEIGMLTLFQCTTGGRDWGSLYDMVSASGPMYAALFIAYILFFIFALFNIVTSIFVDRAMRLAQPDAESAFLAQRAEDMSVAHALRSLLATLDEDGTGLINYEDLVWINQDYRVRELYEKVGLNVRDAGTFFKTVSRLAGADVLDIDTFVAGAMKMKGFASSLDVQAIIFQVQELTHELHTITSALDVKPQCRRCKTPALSHVAPCAVCGITGTTGLGVDKSSREISKRSRQS